MHTKEEDVLAYQPITKEKEKIEVPIKTKTEKKKVKKNSEVKKEDNSSVRPTVKKIPKVNITTATTAYIIVGSFGVEKNAKKLVAKLRDVGYDQAEIISKNNKYHKVSIDGFNTIESAKKELKIIRKEYSSAWILEDN